MSLSDGLFNELPPVLNECCLASVVYIDYILRMIIIIVNAGGAMLNERIMRPSL